MTVTTNLDRGELSRRFADDGVVLPLRVMDESEAAGWLAAFDRNERRFAEHPRLRRPYTDYRRANFHVVNPTACALASHPAIVDLVEPILGPDILCWMVEMFFKAPHSDAVVSLHQDLTYWGFNNSSLVTVWLALEDVSIENGCMQIVRGSHQLGQVAHHDTFAANNMLSRGQHAAVVHDPADEVDIELRAGEVSLHHGHVLHGSGPNHSGRRRCGVAIRYVDPTMAPVHGNDDYGLLVRGVNHTGNLRTILPPDEEFSDASLTLFDEISAAQAVALSEGAEHELAYTRPLEQS